MVMIVMLNSQLTLQMKHRKHDFKIVALETDKDHCHLFLNALPNYSLSDIMAKIKEGQVKC